MGLPLSEIISSFELARYSIENFIEAYNLLTGGEASNDTDRAYSYDDFCKPRYFGGRLDDFLEEIQEKINLL